MNDPRSGKAWSIALKYSSAAPHSAGHLVRGAHVEREQRQAIVAFALELRLLERSHDVSRAVEGREREQVFPRRVGHAVHGLAHARPVEVLLEPLDARVRGVLLERVERAVAVRERGLEALERARLAEYAACGARGGAVVVQIPEGCFCAVGAVPLIPWGCSHFI